MRPKSIILYGVVALTALAALWALAPRNQPPRLDLPPAELDSSTSSNGMETAPPAIEEATTPSIRSPVDAGVDEVAAESIGSGAASRADSAMIRVDAVPFDASLPPVQFELWPGGAVWGRRPVVDAGAWTRVPKGSYEVSIRAPFELAKPLALEVESPEQRWEAALAVPTKRVDIYLEDEFGRPAVGVDIGSGPSDASGRVVFLSYSAGIETEFTVRPSDPSLVLSASQIRWDAREVTLQVLSRTAMYLEVSSSWAVDEYWLHCLSGCRERGAQQNRKWRSINDPLLLDEGMLHPSARYAVVFRGEGGCRFGLCSLGDGSRAQFVLPDLCRVSLDLDERLRTAATPVVVAMDASGTLAVHDDVTDVRGMPDGPLTQWLISHTVAGVSDALLVPKGVRFLVALQIDGCEERYGPFVVHGDGPLRLQEASYRVQRAGIVDVLVDELREPIRISMKYDSQFGGGQSREIRGDCTIPIDVPNGQRSVTYSAFSKVGGIWALFHHGAIDLHEGTPLSAILDLRGLVPKEVHGFLDMSGLASPLPGRDLALMFYPVDQIAVVGGVRFGGLKKPIQGPGVAHVDGNGRFALALRRGNYLVHVVDPYGEDLGFATQPVDCRPGAELRVAVEPRVLYVGRYNTETYGIPEVAGPDGVCEVVESPERGAMVVGARSGKYRVVWRNGRKSIVRTISVAVRDREKQLPDIE